MENKIYTFFILILILCSGILLICTKGSDNVTLDEVKLKENEVSKKQFAIYIRDSKYEEYREYTNNNLFPEGYKLDSGQSGCLDSNGNKVNDEEIISLSENNKIMIKSNKTVYCYLYFEKSSFSGTGNDLVESNPDGLTKNLVADLYRYIGTTDNEPNNYICFGTTDKESCTSTDSEFKYRIIGITEDGKLKLMKNKATITSTKWNNSHLKDAYWDNSNERQPSDLYINLNGNEFLNVEKYIPTKWKEKISETAWNIGDVNNTGNNYTDTGENVWKWERKIQATNLSKIGLMYLSDYYYSLDGSGSLDCNSGGIEIYNKCKTSWLNTTAEEWTMTRFGKNSQDIYLVWEITSSGNAALVTSEGVNRLIRPIFYLIPETKISSGTGTNEDPYILSGFHDNSY